MYDSTPLPKFLFALAIIALPEFLLADSNPKWARAYAFLVLLSYAVYNYRGLARFAAFVRRELAQ